VRTDNQGSPYGTKDCQRMLAANGITCSMSRRGNAHDNAAMKSWNSTLKAELGERSQTCAGAKQQFFAYIEVFYNQQRRHSTLGYVSPSGV
jgi:putative transposase